MGALFVVMSSFMFSLTHRFSEPNLKTVRELIYKRGYGKVVVAVSA